MVSVYLYIYIGQHFLKLKIMILHKAKGLQCVQLHKKNSWAAKFCEIKNALGYNNTFVGNKPLGVTHFGRGKGAEVECSETTSE